MFNPFLIIAFVKGSLPNVVKYFKYIVIVAIAALLTFMAYKVYSAVTEKLAEIQNNKVLVQTQAKQLEDQFKAFQEQEKVIKEMVLQVEQLKESNTQTQEVLQSLYTEQINIKKKVQTKKQAIDTGIRDVDNDTMLTPQEKEVKRSEVLITGMHSTYCELFGTECQ
jgi:Tfp pilus assembly protein PilE